MKCESSSLLTIAIPTYNRFEQLKSNVCSILDCRDPRIHVFVADNHSPDPRVLPFLKKCKEEYVNFDFIVQDKNLGPDRNFLSCLSAPNSTYIHLLGDDDIVEPGKENLLFSFLADNPNLSFVFCDYGRTTEVFSKNDLFSFARRAGVLITYMSLLVFSKRTLGLIEDKEKYIGTLLIQSHLAYLSLSRSDRPFAIFGGWSFLAGTGINNAKTLSYDFLNVFVACYHDLIYSSGTAAGLNRKQSRAIFGDSTYFVVPWIVRLRRVNPKALKKPFFYFLKYLFFFRRGWTRYLPACYCPLSWLNRIHPAD